jgi:hypothetical protein
MGGGGSFTNWCAYIDYLHGDIGTVLRLAQSTIMNNWQPTAGDAKSFGYEHSRK